MSNGFRAEHDQVVPTVFIGLGGSGRQVLMRLRKRLHDEYPNKAIDSIGFAKFLMVDMYREQWWPTGEVDHDYAAVRPLANESIDCQISRADFFGVFDKMEKENVPLFSGWLKPSMRNYVHRSVNTSPGIHRQFGRLAFLLNVEAIRHTIKMHIKSVLAYAATLPSDLLGRGASVTPNVIEIVIVGSLAGGTGAGMLIDTTYLVKDILRDPDIAVETQYTNLIAVMPTGFKGKVDEATFAKCQQNAYATLLELEYYGTPRTGDEMFLGKAIDPHAQRKNRVGFHAPWKAADDNFIEGSGWEACYLIDNVNPLDMDKPLSLPDTYQMIATYLFIDFRSSDVAILRRSRRSILAQFQDTVIHTKIRRAVADGAPNAARRINTDVVYARSNGCSFSSFGLAEITFDKDRVYRAAGYRLATNLVLRRWLRVAGAVKVSQYRQWAAEDLLNPSVNPDNTRPPSFSFDRLLLELYRFDRGNWLGEIEQDFKTLDQVHCTQGSSELRKVLTKHRTLLEKNSQGESGRALQTAEERARELCGTPTSLHGLRTRLRDATFSHINRDGVSPTLELLKYYRSALTEISDEADACASAPAISDAAVFARLTEADSVPFPGRSAAQNIEFPLARVNAKAQVETHYKRAATAPRPSTGESGNVDEPGFIQKVIREMTRYIGGVGENIPHDLDRLKTLSSLLVEAKSFFEELGTRLEKRFTDSYKGKETDRKQAIVPTTWDGHRYDVEINKALVSDADIGQCNITEELYQYDWSKLETKILSRLHEIKPQEFERVRTLSDLLEHLFSFCEITDQSVEKVADVLATACRDVLRSGPGLDLADFEDGSVVDLLVRSSRDERDIQLQRLVRSSAPCFPLDIETILKLGMPPRHQFSMLGITAGDHRSSLHNVEVLATQIQQVAAAMNERVDRTPLQGNDKSSVVLCREVWGVPLQYYRFLNQLHQAYTAGAKRDSDECHLNYNESSDCLPDIRAIKSDDYEHIRDYIETVLFAVITGEIKGDQNGIFNVEVRCHDGNVDTFRLGSRLNRIVENACNEPAVREHLCNRRASWKQGATPQKWAMLYCSGLLTYNYSKNEIGDEMDRYSPPLRNCFDILLNEFEKELQPSEEGRRWLKFVGYPDPAAPDFPERIRDFDALMARLIGEYRILRRASERIPIFQVDWCEFNQLQLPEQFGSP